MGETALLGVMLSLLVMVPDTESGYFTLHVVLHSHFKYVMLNVLQNWIMDSSGLLFRRDIGVCLSGRDVHGVSL